MRRSVYVASVVVGVCTALSCTRLPQQTPPAPPRPLPTGAVAPGAPSVPYREKTRAERMEFMGLVFYPKMKALFRGQDSQRPAPFRCQTCHGEDMEAVNFKMPNGLSTLPAEEPLPRSLAQDPKTTRFMVDQVEPAVDELLGLSHDPGRSCGLCHGVE